LKQVNLFVSAIGLVFVSPIGETPEPTIRQVVEVNLTSVFRCSRWMFDHFRTNGGGVMIHVVSDAALRSIHHIPMYTTAKAGLLVMSELMAAEGAPHSIRVNAICPGATVPGVQATIAGFEHHAENASTWGRAPSGRHGTPSDIARSVVWLASADAEHVSGATLRVDGAASAAMRGGTRA
jgi:NAD(P)-dependent dehydrogenase (short-subunit alcohol dehydrogenase family)